MHEIKVLCLLFIFTIVPGNIDNLGIKVALTGKSKNKIKNYGESCVYDSDCGYRLSCISYNCRCKNNEFWNNTYCETLKNNGESCVHDTECGYRLSCIFHICRCQNNGFWNNTYCETFNIYGKSCVHDSDCGYRLSCIFNICRCKNNEFWNSTYCETKLVLFFTPSNYNNVTIDNFNGTMIVNADDIKVIEQPKYYIYVTADDPGVLIQYTENASYVRHVNLSDAYGLETVNNSKIYVTSSWGSRTMFIYNASLNVEYNSVPINDITYLKFPWFIRYNPSNGYLYECDFSRYVNVFDLSYNRIESFKIDYPDDLYHVEYPLSIGFYQSATSDNLFLVTTYYNKIRILKQTDKTLYKTIDHVCNIAYPKDILVDQKSGYFLVICNSDNSIQLWHTNGTEFVNTGKTINMRIPYGMCFDSSGRLLITSYSGGFFSILTLV